MYIKVYLSEEEKKTLDGIAGDRNISVSNLCHEQFYPLLHPAQEQLLESSVNYHDSRNDILTRCVKIYMSETEYSRYLAAAKGIPISRYLRRVLLDQGNPIRIDVYTDDISALTIKVSGYIEQLNSFIAALAIRQQLYEADYKRLIRIADETRIALRDAATYAMKNRYSIRASGIRILRKRIHKAVSDIVKDNDRKT